jgi:hypothetical protein
MLQAFHNLLIAWSDDGGATWTPQLAYDAGIGHDTPTPFVAFTLDNQGNPYFSFTAPPPREDPVTGNPSTYPPTCNWNLYAGQSLNLTASPAPSAQAGRKAS